MSLFVFLLNERRETRVTNDHLIIFLLIFHFSSSFERSSIRGNYFWACTGSRLDSFPNMIRTAAPLPCGLLHFSGSSSSGARSSARVVRLVAARRWRPAKLGAWPFSGLCSFNAGIFFDGQDAIEFHLKLVMELTIGGNIVHPDPLGTCMGVSFNCCNHPDSWRLTLGVAEDGDSNQVVHELVDFIASYMMFDIIAKVVDKAELITYQWVLFITRRVELFLWLSSFIVVRFHLFVASLLRFFRFGRHCWGKKKTFVRRKIPFKTFEKN